MDWANRASYTVSVAAQKGTIGGTCMEFEASTSFRRHGSYTQLHMAGKKYIDLPFLLLIWLIWPTKLQVWCLWMLSKVGYTRQARNLKLLQSAEPMIGAPSSMWQMSELQAKHPLQHLMLGSHRDSQARKPLLVLFFHLPLHQTFMLPLLSWSYSPCDRSSFYSWSYTQCY